MKPFLYYLTTSLFAIIIGLTLTNIIQPGEGVNIGSNGFFDHTKLQSSGSPTDILIRITLEVGKPVQTPDRARCKLSK